MAIEWYVYSGYSGCMLADGDGEMTFKLLMLPDGDG